LLSNLYLDPLDHLMHHRGYEMVRYADDFVILCRSQAEAESALEIVRKWTEENGLVLHPIKTRVVDANLPGGFDFLGYHFERGYRWPSEKAMNRLKEKIRKRTRRTDGRSLSMIIKDLNLVLRGWYEYFKHGHRIAFRTTDSWIRMRLRSILRKRNGGHGRGHGADHNRWPNVFFADQGLMSLLETLDLELQSLKR
jgi:RNA-directed DNA polymerase